MAQLALSLARVGKVPFFCIKYIDTLFFSVLQIPDDLSERNESIPDTQYDTPTGDVA